MIFHWFSMIIYFLFTCFYTERLSAAWVSQFDITPSPVKQQGASLLECRVDRNVLWDCWHLYLYFYWPCNCLTHSTASTSSKAKVKNLWLAQGPAQGKEIHCPEQIQEKSKPGSLSGALTSWAAMERLTVCSWSLEKAGCPHLYGSGNQYLAAFLLPG